MKFLDLFTFIKTTQIFVDCRYCSLLLNAKPPLATRSLPERVVATIVHNCRHSLILAAETRLKNSQCCDNTAQ